MPRRVLLSAALAGTLVAVSVAPLSTAFPLAIAADPTTPVAGVLDRRIVDVAVVPGTDDSPPELVTLGPSGGRSGSITLSILRRGPSGWVALSELSVVLDETVTGSGTPWLLELGHDRFAVLQSVSGEQRTSIGLFVIARGGAEPVLVPNSRIAIPTTVVDAGAADVDGDGTQEIVVASDGGGVCEHSEVQAFDGDSLLPVAAYQLPYLSIGGAAIGEFDGIPGDDMLAYVIDTCTVRPGVADHILAFRLVDGSAIQRLPGSSAREPGAWSGAPWLVDVDADGRDEALVRSGTELVLVDPKRDWETLPVASAGALALGGMPIRTIDGPGAVLAWLHSASATRANDILTLDVGRGADGALAVRRVDRLDLDIAEPDRLAVVLEELQAAAFRNDPGPAWMGDVLNPPWPFGLPSVGWPSPALRSVSAQGSSRQSVPPDASSSRRSWRRGRSSWK